MNTQADIKSTHKNLDFIPKITLEKGIEAYASEIILLHEKSIP